MIIFTDIVNDKIINLDDVKPWLLKNCEKWIILNKKSNIYIIFLSNKSARLDSIIRSFKGFIFKINEHVKINTKKINQEENFSQILKTYFCKTNNTFDNIKLKGYTKKYLFSLLEKNNDNADAVNDDDLNIKICVYCSKSFQTKFNTLRHQQICKKKTIIDEKTEVNIESIINDKVENIVKNQLTNINDNMTNMFKELNDKLTNVQQVSQIQQVTNNTNNVNIQINNYKTKKDKLNHYLKNMIDIDTFINNYQHNKKYHLTKDESQTLLENSQNLGISSYGDGLFTYLKKKYCLQLQDLDLIGNEKKYHEVILPFICSDINLRNHYELTKNGWLLNKNNDKIKSIVNISDQQIFNHHNRFICYSSKKGKNTVINIFLKKSDYSQIEPQLTDSPSTNSIEA
jgi:hypothetical protein